jgi:hypothetical protein
MDDAIERGSEAQGEVNGMKHTHPLKGLGFRPPRLGVRLPVARDALSISDEEYKRRLDAFMRAQGYPSSKMGFLGNWSFHGRLEEDFRHVLREELGDQYSTAALR